MSTLNKQFQMFEIMNDTPLQLIEQIGQLIKKHTQKSFISKIVNDNCNTQRQINIPIRVIKDILKSVIFIDCTLFTGARLSGKLPSISLCQIEHIKWSFLIELDLNACQIHSIKPMSFLIAPKLKILKLKYNYIISLKSLAKTYFKNIQSIQLTGNGLSANQMHHFSRIYHKQIKQLSFQDNLLQSNQSFRNLLKLASMDLQRRISINSSRLRIRVQKSQQFILKQVLAIIDF